MAYSVLEHYPDLTEGSEIAEHCHKGLESEEGHEKQMGESNVAPGCSSNQKGA